MPEDPSIKKELIINGFRVPEWAGKPPEGLHMDVLKDNKMVQKLMLDEKKCYFFGRNRQMCDFAVDHQSCSRCHAALVWHSSLNCCFLVDLGSVHGTYVGKIRLEPNTPQKIAVGSDIHFGVSTRAYVIREKPRIPGISGDFAAQQNIIGPAMRPGNQEYQEDSMNNSFVLPEVDYELDNLTEFNTAHNRRITKLINLGIMETGKKRSKNKGNVHFNDHDEVINPEDVDPAIGRFRNLVEQSFIPNKRRSEEKGSANMGISVAKKPAVQIIVRETSLNEKTSRNMISLNNNNEIYNPSYNLAAKLGLPMPNLAPDLNEDDNTLTLHQSIKTLHRINFPGLHNSSHPEESTDTEICPRKKKYVKEAWPGKAPNFLPVGPAFQ